MEKKKRKRLHGVVQKVIKSKTSSEPEKAQIGIDEAEELYREVRVENIMIDEDGEKARLKPGAEVDVVVEADENRDDKKMRESFGVNKADCAA